MSCSHPSNNGRRAGLGSYREAGHTEPPVAPRSAPGDPWFACGPAFGAISVRELVGLKTG
jgi:hypothetical protein